MALGLVYLFLKKKAIYRGVMFLFLCDLFESMVGSVWETSNRRLGFSAEIG